MLHCIPTTVVAPYQEICYSDSSLYTGYDMDTDHLMLSSQYRNNGCVLHSDLQYNICYNKKSVKCNPKNSTSHLWLLIEDGFLGIYTTCYKCCSHVPNVWPENIIHHCLFKIHGLLTKWEDLKKNHIAPDAGMIVWKCGYISTFSYPDSTVIMGEGWTLDTKTPAIITTVVTKQEWMNGILRHSSAM